MSNRRPQNPARRPGSVILKHEYARVLRSYHKRQAARDLDVFTVRFSIGSSYYRDERIYAASTSAALAKAQPMPGESVSLAPASKQREDKDAFADTIIW